MGVFSFKGYDDKFKELFVNYAFLVFIGGGVGATARYWLSGTVYRWANTSFPYGTITVNVIGCFVIGFLMTSLEERFLATPAMRVFLTIGILGGFTTFSTFSFETIKMIEDSQFQYAIVNIGMTLATCLSGTYVGTIFGRLI